MSDARDPMSASAGPTGPVAAAWTAFVDELPVGGHGDFEVTLGRQRPREADRTWIELPAGASSVWVRHFHCDVRTDRLGWCRIDPLGATPPTAAVVDRVPKVWRSSTVEPADFGLVEAELRERVASLGAS